MPVPPQLIAILKARSSDNQSTALVSQIVPPRVQSNLLQGRGRLSQRGPAGSRLQPAPSPAQSARDRMQNARDRMRNRARGNN
jgi:hypothetical protein